MTKSEQTCIEDLKKIVVKSAADFQKLAADYSVFLSFDSRKLDDLFLFYGKIKNIIKEEITSKPFYINAFKISSIISFVLIFTMSYIQQK